MRVLITGITEFIGGHFAECALGQGAKVNRSYRWRGKSENWRNRCGSQTP